MRTNIKAVSDVNPHTHDITVPVVLVNGADDIVSNHKKILDGNEREQLKGANREIFLKEKILSKSPYVKMVIPEKTSNHGLLRKHLCFLSIVFIKMYLTRGYIPTNLNNFFKKEQRQRRCF